MFLHYLSFVILQSLLDLAGVGDRRKDKSFDCCRGLAPCTLQQLNNTQGRGKFAKITISLNSTKTKISYETMKNVKENYHRL